MQGISTSTTPLVDGPGCFMTYAPYSYFKSLRTKTFLFHTNPLLYEHWRRPINPASQTNILRRVLHIRRTRTPPKQMPIDKSRQLCLLVRRKRTMRMVRRLREPHRIRRPHRPINNPPDLHAHGRAPRPQPINTILNDIQPPRRHQSRELMVIMR